MILVYNLSPSHLKTCLMKKFSLFLLMAVFAISAYSCGGDDDASSVSDNVTITLSKEKFDVPSSECSLTVDVTCSGREWTAFSDADWVKVQVVGSTSAKGHLSLSVTANTTSVERVAHITVRSGLTRKTIEITQGFPLSLSDTEFYSSSKGQSFRVAVVSWNNEFTVHVNSNWIQAKHVTDSGTDYVEITTSANESTESRSAVVTVSTANESADITVHQSSIEDQTMYCPDGYHLVWHDEFDDGTVLNANDWTHEVQKSGWVNNELQNYVNRTTPDGEWVTRLNNGKLNIRALKENGKIYSGRVYAKVKSGWTYGYIEASIKLPKGKGTWPAFWMMPVNFRSWPADGEIDIMEEVGYHPNYVSSSLHANAHVHSEGTQVTHEMYCAGAEDEFHTYAILWTHENITTYVDGQLQLSYDNRGLGRDDWPYDDPFYVIFNLAWGGSWGGQQGVDENALPAVMEVDYIRVFQK